MKKKANVSDVGTRLVSFKVSHEIYKQLEKYGADELDEAGLQLSPSLVARRLMLQALRKTK